MEIQDLYEKLKSLPQIEALALGGSRSSGNTDNKSDYDLYAYVTENIDNEVREKLLSGLCERMEIGNHYWEFEDNIVLNGGVYVDIIYRSVETYEQFMTFVVEDGHAMNGYTTCFWHNIKESKIIFDKTGKFTELQKKFDVPYPEKLKKAIIERNMKLLSGHLPSYDKQITKAYDRHDYVSINHRVAAFLESYFDVIFAVNEMTHPGEKKLLRICKEQCKVLPENFEGNIVGLFEYMFKYDVSDILEDMVEKLKKIID